jgi:hypothetical protein
MAVWYSLWSFGTYTFPVLVCLDLDKSGNPDGGLLSLERTLSVRIQKTCALV